MAVAHNLGFPRIGAKRESKKAVEAYWRGELSEEALMTCQREREQENWALQAQAGLDWIPVGDFAWYDHVLNTSLLFGVIPERFKACQSQGDLNTAFCMARGQAPGCQEAQACEMTKWFDTNYHYIVPEFSPEQNFSLSPDYLLASIDAAIAQGHPVKPVLLGPLSFLWLGKTRQQSFDKLSLLDKLLPCYKALFDAFEARGIEYVQVDEPILVLELPESWQAGFEQAYHHLSSAGTKTLLTTYFGDLKENTALACRLPAAGLHVDAVRAPEATTQLVEQFPSDKILSLGVVDGRNIWRSDLEKILPVLEKAQATLGDRLWVAPSCSLLHVPVDLDQETKLAPEIKQWLAFAKQKVAEIRVITQALNEGRESIAQALEECTSAFEGRKHSARIHNPQVQERTQAITANMYARSRPYAERASEQQATLKLPRFATTTIGSFPQTGDIRALRRDFKRGDIDLATYEQRVKTHIQEAITIQEGIGLDVLVHGEAERNDMVEYFGELLAGFAFTQNGWVQSYGSRCVKPPIIYGDVSRQAPMTVRWSQYAQSLSSRLVKGMLTGPVTILAWSFVRDDQSDEATATQIALALRDEVCDLEKAGIKIIQIDEPAFRETLPLRREDWQAYLHWAAKCFRLASSGVEEATQIHTHMCYAEFNDIMHAIADLDADVITLESSRSDMELLEAFKDFSYPNEIGPGVYDIHSPRVPSTEEMHALLRKALERIPAQRLWVNPDCGLKTRGWPEVKRALENMVQAASQLREEHPA